MLTRLNYLLDLLSEFIAHRKGLLPILGILIISGNFVIQFVPWFGWFADSNCLLHIGSIIAIVGILLGWAL